MTRKDIFSKKQRSKIMSSIRGKNTKIEKLIQEGLKNEGLKFEMHAKLPGTPDFAFPDQRLIVFCHGDFWHGKNYDTMEKKLNKYWQNKILTNMKRDARVARRLRKLGWSIMVIKGSAINANVEKCIERIKRRLRNKRIEKCSEKVHEWFCMRYHKGHSCAEIARKYGVTRQAVNRTLLSLAYRKLYQQCPQPKCSLCKKSVIVKEEDIKTNKYDVWKEYSPKEIKYMKIHLTTKTVEQIAKSIGRTPLGVAAKIRRLSER